MTNEKTYRWEIDGDHTQVRFAVRHMVITVVRGIFRSVSGTMTADENGFPTDIQIAIDASTISTDNYDRDMHLLSPAFFDVQAFPLITFQSTAIEKLNDERLRITGNLTLRSVTQSLTFEAEYGGTAVGFGGLTHVGYSIEMQINRFDVGLLWDEKMGDGTPIIAPEVKLEIDCEFIRSEE
jgi:polyisoprenoid-binding protein YceI